METHDVQLQYWNQFPRLKRDAIYINRYHGDLERIDLALEMVSAVTSSAAIGGWAIWHAAAFLWGAVIAASQVRLASRRRVNHDDRNADPESGLGPGIKRPRCKAWSGPSSVAAANPNASRCVTTPGGDTTATKHVQVTGTEISHQLAKPDQTADLNRSGFATTRPWSAVACRRWALGAGRLGQQAAPDQGWPRLAAQGLGGCQDPICPRPGVVLGSAQHRAQGQGEADMMLAAMAGSRGADGGDGRQVSEAFCSPMMPMI